MTYWIGRVEPSMYFEGAWWQQVAPEDVRLAILSLGVSGVGGQQEMEWAHAQILSRVELLDREGVDVINVGGSPVVSVYGREGHARLLEDIGRITSRPFVTSIQAEIEGLRAVGAGRVVIASPYPTPVTQKRVVTLEEDGLEVVGQLSLECTRARQIAMLEPDVVFKHALDAASAYPQADVIYMPCGSFPVPPLIRRIEEATGKPVVSNVQSQATASLKRIGYPKPIHGFGKLMESIGTELAAEPVAVA